MATVSDGFLASTADKVLSFWSEHGDLQDPEAVAQLLGFDQSEVAIASRLPKSKVRLQGKIPTDLMRQLLQWAVLLERVARFFDGDERKTAAWFKTPNLQLGGLEPREYVLYGRAGKLREIIEHAILENEK